jgi:apolipoprotein D and lipocalin family protein
MKTQIRNLLTLACGLLFSNACAPRLGNLNVIKPFEVQKYLGEWYEIARLDHSFERNLNSVTATYTLNSDSNTIAVCNRGYNSQKKKWSEAFGKAKFQGDKSEARLAVSFFGPFYAPYNVIALDNDYNYALIVSNNLNYLWILSRYKTIPNEIKSNFLQKARDIGFNVDKLIWVEQN